MYDVEFRRRKKKNKMKWYIYILKLKLCNEHNQFSMASTVLITVAN